MKGKMKDETSLERLKKHKTRADWWNEISEDEKNAIDKGLADIKSGKVRPHKEVKKLYAKW